MDIKEMLLENYKKKFEVNSCISALEDKVEAIAKVEAFELYRDFEILRNGYVYKLNCVSARFHNYDPSTMPDVQLSLIYFCISKLVKKDREALKKEKDLLKSRRFKRLSYSMRKKPLFFENCYNVKLENVLNGEIRLEIK